MASCTLCVFNSGVVFCSYAHTYYKIEFDFILVLSVCTFGPYRVIRAQRVLAGRSHPGGHAGQRDLRGGGP